MSMSKLIGNKREVKKVSTDTNLPCCSTLLGVEVELEGVIANKETEFWEHLPDGSLRNGIEYRYKEPLNGEDVQASLTELQSIIDNSTVHLSDRCSVHVHVNVSDLEQEVFINFLVLYIIFERVLFKQHNDRDKSPFCVPWYSSPLIYKTLLDGLQATNLNNWDLYRSTDKYSALNLLRLTDLGTIEFRHMGGVTDTSEIYKWIQILLHLKNASVKSFDLKELPGELSCMGVRNFLREVFKAQANDLIYPEIDRDIIKGIRFAELLINRDALCTIQKSVLRSKTGRAIKPKRKIHKPVRTSQHSEWMSVSDFFVGIDEASALESTPEPELTQDLTEIENLTQFYSSLRGL